MLAAGIEEFEGGLLIGDDHAGLCRFEDADHREDEPPHDRVAQHDGDTLGEGGGLRG